MFRTCDLADWLRGVRRRLLRLQVRRRVPHVEQLQLRLHLQHINAFSKGIQPRLKQWSGQEVQAHD